MAVLFVNSHDGLHTAFQVAARRGVNEFVGHKNQQNYLVVDFVVMAQRCKSASWRIYAGAT
jgi:hypothetical protein